MTKADRRKIHRYILTVAQAMNLGHWEIILSDGDPTDELGAAEVYSARGRRTAIVSVASDFLETPKSQQRHVIVHELVHVHFACPDHVIHQSVSEEIHRAWNVSCEYSIDAIAEVLAPFMPMPE